MHNRKFSESCGEIEVKLNKRWHETMSLVFLFHLCKLTSRFNVTFSFSRYYILSFPRWMFGMVLRKRSPWERSLHRTSARLFLWSLWFLWTPKSTFIAKIWFILNILIFCQILHNFKVVSIYFNVKQVCSLSWWQLYDI